MSNKKIAVLTTAFSELVWQDRIGRDIMNVLRWECCSFLHTGRERLINMAKKGKSAKEVIKLINRSSLAHMESEILDNSTIPLWKSQKLALRDKFEGKGWNPKKKLSRTEMDSIRLLREQFPDLTASDLGERFKVSPEAIRRILKSKWKPTESENTVIHQRWKERGERIKEMYETTYEEQPKNIDITPAMKILSSKNNSSELIFKAFKKESRKKRPVNNNNNNNDINRHKKNDIRNRKDKLYLLERSISKNTTKI